VFIACSEWNISWDIFRRAYEGRELLAFQSPKSPSRLAFSGIKDARRRYRNPNVERGLASVLATIKYTKESYP
jgi:hypothetical protein